MKKTISLIILISLVLLFLRHCTHFGWDVYKPKGLPKETYDVLVNVGDSVFYIGGRSSKYFFNKSGTIDTTIIRTKLYSSIDLCKNWKEVVLNQFGNVSNLHVEGDTLIIANQFLQLPPTVLFSYDKGNSWSTVLEVEKSNYIQDISFNSGLGIIAAIRSNSTVKLLAIDERIDTLISLSNSYYNLELVKNRAYFIEPSQDKTIMNQGVIVFDYRTKELRRLSFEKDYKVVSKGTDNSGSLLLVVEDKKDHYAILRVKSKIEKIELGEYSGYRVNSVSGNSNRIFVDVHQPANMSILGITHELIFTDDDGMSWQKDDFPNSLSTKPFSTLNDGGFITYSAFGEFQRLK